MQVGCARLRQAFAQGLRLALAVWLIGKDRSVSLGWPGYRHWREDYINTED